MGVSSDSPNFWVPPIISGTDKATDFKFCRIGSICTVKAHEKILGIVAVGVVRESRKFTGYTYRAHCAVIFAIAQLSCGNWNIEFTFHGFVVRMSECPFHIRM